MSGLEPLAPPPDEVARRRAAPRPPLGLIFTITITGILANTLVGPAIPDILDAFDQPDASAGLFVAAGTLPGIAVAPLIGLLADRYGRRAVLVPCLCAFGGFGLLSAAAPSFELLLACRLLQGVGSAGLINLAIVLIGDSWSGLERARRVGQNAAVLTVSLAVFPPVGGGLTALGGWRLSFTPYALGFLTAALVWRRLGPGGPAQADGTFRSQARSLGSMALKPAVLGPIGVGFVIFFLIFGLFLTALPIHLEREFGLEAWARGLIIAAPSVTSTITALSLGWLRARIGAVGLLVASAVLFALGFVVIGVAGTLPVLVVGAFAYGLGEGIAIPTLQDVVSEAAPAVQRGGIMAVWVGAARAGQTVGPLAAGQVYAAIGTGATFVAGGALAASLVAVEALGRYGDPERTRRARSPGRATGRSRPSQ